MSQAPTAPHGESGMPVRSLRIEVLEGPSAGESRSGDADTFSIGTAPGNDLVLDDPTVSRYHVVLSPSSGGVAVVDHRSTNGTLVNGVRIERGVVPVGSVLHLGRSALRVLDGEKVTVELHEGEVLAGLHGRTPIMRRLMARLERAAGSDATVLLLGESGTGKELIARALHDLGPRRGGPFITVDAGAIPAALVASELFGHERGAFTGAERRREGAFEQARGGTIFLDEVGELPHALQTALLGVLERRRFRRVGGREEIAFDARLVAATHRDLRAEVNAGTFRLDLYYRLMVVLLQVPPLRERAADIPLLVEHFLREWGHDGPVDALFSPQALAALAMHHWPGNVRELRNVIEATLAMGVPPPLPAQEPDAETDPIDRLVHLPYREARSRLLRDFEQRFLDRLMARCGGNVSRAAREARMNRSHLIDLLKRLRAGGSPTGE